MIVAFLKTKLDSLNQNAKDGLSLSPLWVRFGEPAVWTNKTGPPRDWYVHSDPRITTDDLALSATILANPQLIKANYDTPGKTEADRVTGAVKTREDALSSVVDWDRGVVGTETVTVTVSERVVLSYDSVSQGMFCIATGPVEVEYERDVLDANGDPIFDPVLDGNGDPVLDEFGTPMVVQRTEMVTVTEEGCVEWEERFKQVPVYEQVDSGEVDENGDPIMVDKWVDVDYEVTQDVYLSPQEIMELQGPQVKNWVKAGVVVIDDLEPVVDDG